MAMAERKPHAVMLAMPLAGHINPMLELCYILASKGFIVTFVNTEFNRTLTPSISNPNIRFKYIPDGLPPEHGRTTHLVELLKSVYAHMGGPFEKLIESLLPQEPSITCIIANGFLDFAQHTAKKLGLPYVAFWTQSAASYASVLLVAKGYRPPKDARPSDLIRCSISGVPPLKLEDMNTFMQCYDPEDFMFNVFNRPFQSIGESHCILINSFEELEQETLATLRKEHPVYAVGPLLPPSFFEDRQQHTLEAEEDLCLQWLDKQDEGSVLYVCFGTLAMISAEQVAEIALGLEASQHPFLWVVRTGLMADGKAADQMPNGFLERVKTRSLIMPWAPQLKVLLHKAIGGFFTHCGWNSTLEGISAGVPLLCWSFISDQPLNCRCAVDSWKVGMSLARGEGGVVSKEELAKKVEELMVGTQGKALRAKAAGWREAAKRAVRQQGGSSLTNLQLFSEDITSRLSIHALCSSNRA